ncbi:MAG: hypothetical protein R3E89_20245, partial [Thiolinea sp.]
LLRDFTRRNTASLIITTHHIEEVIPEIERVILLKRGRIIADGDKAQVLSSDNLSLLYDTDIQVTERHGWYRCWF